MSSLVDMFTFSDLKAQVIKNFKSDLTGGLFYVEVDRDEIWDRYLSGFSEDKRQEHTCNSCKSFLRQYGGLVSIIDNKMVSLWDGLEVSKEYRKPIQNLSTYIHGRPITDIALFEQKKCGVDKNLDRETNIIWNHFYIELPAAVVSEDIGLWQSAARADHDVLKRSLEELTVEATETILELISQGSLYRGKEFEGLLTAFLDLQKLYALMPDSQKDYFCWNKSVKSGALARIKNTSIGTLLIDLGGGVDLDTAVTKFEKVVAPTNYKRPTSLVTPRMVEQAKDTLSSLGLIDSLERRHANETDLNIRDILFTDRPSAITDVFDEVSKDTTVNPRSFSKTEEIGISDFLTNVVPNAKSISILFENSQRSNLVTLLTSKEKDAPGMFKWDNNFSWSYAGAVTDSIKEMVKQAGGNVVGELRTSLSWYNYDDLDIHVEEPDGNEIFYGKKVSATSGVLDVDMNAGQGTSRHPVENIIWTDKSRMQKGTYKVFVHNYSAREMTNQGFVVQIECGGEVFDFEFKANPRSGKKIQVVTEFDYNKETGITFKGEAKSNVISKEQWGIKTNQFHKVTKMLLSPNHWGGTVGNKHYMFMLENCVTDEPPRPFFNEFLKQDLDTHRKVFEILGSKVKIEATDNQLSGLGFSETKRGSMIAKVTGKFTRTLKVNF